MVKADEIGYECEQIENVSINDLRKSYSDGIIIWLCGSGMSSSGHKAHYIRLLEYGGSTQYYSAEVEGNSANKAIIEGAIEAVSHISKAMRLYIINATALGFQTGFKGKGANGDLMQLLFAKIKEKQCAVTEVIFYNGAEKIKKYINDHNPNQKQREVIERQLSDKQLKYKGIIYKECLAKVRDILVKNDVGDEVIMQVMNITVE